MEEKDPFQFDNWAEINYDLLDEIMQRVDSYGDYVRFRSVCKTWNLELSNIPKHIKIPLLVLPFDNESDTTRPFYHVGEKKVIHRLELPETKNSMFRGSSYGWLISVELDGALRMLEPFTRAQINLPPLYTFPDVIDYQPDREEEEYTIKRYDGKVYNYDKVHQQKAYVHKIILSSPPTDHDQDFMAVAIYGEFCRLAFCTRNDKTWTDFTIPEHKPCHVDAIFHEGKVYAVNHAGVIYEYDLKSRIGERRGALRHRINCNGPHEHNLYLIGTSGGLLLVERHSQRIRDGDETVYFYRTCRFNVYKLSQSKWVEVKSLGDYVLVIGSNSSVCVLPHSISQDKGSRIYYSDDNYMCHRQPVGGHDIGIFDLEDGTIQQPFPHARRICPSPIWLL